MAGYLQSGYPISMSQINSVFDGRGNNLFAYRGTQWYTAAGGSGTFPSPTISFSDFFNKGPNPARTVSLAGLPSIEGTAYPGDEAFASYFFYTDGDVLKFTSSGNADITNWTTPITAGIGSSYWIRFTQTGTFGGSSESGDGRGIWYQLSDIRSYGLYRTANGAGGRQYTVEIATDSGGSNIVASTSVIISVEIIF
jgi:hypothetical protein